MCCGCASCPADPASNTAYMAVTRVDKAMLKDDPMDGLGPDHVQMEPNPCGVIMEVKLDDNFSGTSAKVGDATGIACPVSRGPALVVGLC